MATQWQQRQFGGDWDHESENYFPEPLPPLQRVRLPDLSGQPVGIHLGKRGRLVTFYRNGDPHYKGLSASISQKAFISMESLLVWLNEKIPTTAGVRHVFRLPDGRRVRDVAEFQPGGHYVVSSVRRLVRGPDYGGGGGGGGATEAQQPMWHPAAKTPSAMAGHIRQEDVPLLTNRKVDHLGSRHRHHRHHVLSPAGGGGGAPGRGAGRAAPRLITVVSNSHRSSREKVLINPGTLLNFEDLLVDFTSLLVMSGPPVRALYAACPPYRRVESFSQLFREFGDHDVFIACGRELSPVELGGGPAVAKRDAPPATRSGGGSSDGTRGAPGTEKSSPRKLSRRGDDWQQG